jgi:hypothetical protein
LITLLITLGSISISAGKNNGPGFLIILLIPIITSMMRFMTAGKNSCGNNSCGNNCFGNNSLDDFINGSRLTMDPIILLAILFLLLEIFLLLDDLCWNGVMIHWKASLESYESFMAIMIKLMK